MESVSAKELSKKKIDGITVAEPYGTLLGEIETKAIIFQWGPDGSGKSTLSLGMANALAEHGRVEYIPAEEHFGKTLIDRINRLKATHKNLHFGSYEGLEKLKKWLKSSGSKFCVLDSISVVNAKDDAIVDFAQWCRDNGIGFIMVAHATKNNSYRGNTGLAHEADICIEVIKEEGLAQARKNRYLGELRSIPVPFTHEHLKKYEKENRDRADGVPKTEESDSDFNKNMDEVEELLSE